MKEIARIPVWGYGISSSEYGEELFNAITKLPQNKKFVAVVEEGKPDLEGIAPEDLPDPRDAPAFDLVLYEELT